MNTIFFKWPDFKSVSISKNLSIQFVEYEKRYEIFAYDSAVKYETELWKDTTVVEGLDIAQNNSDKDDFETNYKVGANKSIVAKTIDKLPKFLAAVSPDEVSLYVKGAYGTITGASGIIDSDFAEEIQLQGLDVYVKNADFGDFLDFEVGYVDAQDNWVKLKTFGERVYTRDESGWVDYHFKNNAVSKIPTTVKLRLKYTAISILTQKKVILHYITHK